MTVTSLAPIFASIGFLAYVFLTLRPQGRASWVFPALLSAAFLVFSVVTVAQEGPLGFWHVHTAALWGNQVWMDLLIAVAVGWTLILPRARAQGMLPLPWLLLIIATGCIGLLACLARVMYLEARGPKA